MNPNFSLIPILLITLVLSACGGGGGGGSSDAPAAETGSLTVEIGGLPSGTEGAVQITGPDSFSQTITQTTTLTGLAVGDYQLATSAVTANNLSFSASQTTQSVTLSANQGATSLVSYAAPTTSIGVITGFGSVFVNGVKFETDDAVIDTDDDPDALESALEVGMVVTVRGNVGARGKDGTALSIEYEARVEGPIESIDLAGQSLTVLNQTFLVDELTQFENATLESLLIGDIVEISSLEDENGNQVATRIEKEVPGTTTIKLKGELSNLDEAAKTFNIGSLTIDYSNAVIEGTLANAVSVKVKSSAAPFNGILLVDSVVVADDSVASGQQLALDGVISTLVSTEDFSVNAQPILVNEDTEFKGGEQSELVIGLHVKVFGRVADDGTLIASTIRLDKEGVIKLDGVADATSVDDGILTVLGVEILTDSHTQFIDKSDAAIRRFDLADIQPGDALEVKAFDQTGSLVARQVKREETAAGLVEDENSTTSIEGPVSELLAPGFSIRGISIITSEVTEFEGPLDEQLDADEFFALVSAGDKLEVEGVRQEDGSILAFEVEIKGAEDNGRTRVEFEGAVDSFDSIEQFTVNGHAITTDFKTSYKHGGPDDITVDVRVEIKGVQGASGVILAKRIEFPTDLNRGVELEGEIDVFVSGTEFSIGSQALITDENTLFGHGTIEDLDLGVSVEIQGLLTESGVVLVTELEFDIENLIVLEGQVENFISATDFIVGDLKITTLTDTEYVNGSASTLANGVFIEIEGLLNENNILVADEIEFEEPENLSVEGVISVFTSFTDFVVNEQVIAVDEFTEFRHGASVESLTLGVNVRVSGFLNVESVLIAVEIELVDQDSPDDRTPGT